MNLKTLWLFSLLLMAGSYACLCDSFPCPWGTQDYDHWRQVKQTTTCKTCSDGNCTQCLYRYYQCFDANGTPNGFSRIGVAIQTIRNAYCQWMDDFTYVCVKRR